MGALDAESIAFKEGRAQSSPAVPHEDPQTPEQMRENGRASVTIGTEPVDSIANLHIDGPNGSIPLRVYHPDKHRRDLPVLMYIHGGCWFLNSLDTHDSLMRRLANAGKLCVVGVDYRLAPENPFPAGLEDCYVAALWAAQNGASHGFDGSKLALAGDSCGGNLSIAVSMLAKERGKPRLAFQVPIVPMTNTYVPGTSSLNEYGTGFGYDKKVNDQGWELYGAMNPPHSREKPHPLAAVLQAPDLSGLAPAHIVLAECDVVRDEGKAFADRLAKEGQVTVSEFKGVAHGFLLQSCNAPSLGLRVTKGEQAIAEIVQKLHAAFAKVGNEP